MSRGGYSNRGFAGSSDKPFASTKTSNDGEICRFWSEKGSCKFGDRCRNIHQGSIGAHPSGKPSHPAGDAPQKQQRPAWPIRQSSLNSLNSAYSEPMAGQHERGIVTMMKDSFGIIKANGSGKTYFFRLNDSLSSNIREGDKVEFEYAYRDQYKGGKEACAAKVRLLGEPASTEYTRSQNSDQEHGTSAPVPAQPAPTKAAMAPPSLMPLWMQKKAASSSGMVPTAPATSEESLLPRSVSAPAMEQPVAAPPATAPPKTNVPVLSLTPSWMKKKASSSDLNSGRQIQITSSVSLPSSSHPAGSPVWPQRRDIVSAPNTSRGAPLHSKVKRVGSSPDVSTKREQGRVLSIKDHFGFLECTSQAGLPDIFFHLREVQNSVKLKPSDRVDFVLRPDSKNSGRYDAVSVRLSGAGSWMDAGEDESSLAIQDDLSDLSLPPASSPRISAFAADAAPAAQANMFGNTKAMMTWLDAFKNDPSLIMVNKDELAELVNSSEITFSVTEVLLDILSNPDVRSNGGADALYHVIVASNFVKNPRNLRSFILKVYTAHPITKKEIIAMRNIVGLVEELLDRFPEASMTLPLDVLETSLEKVRVTFPADTTQAISRLLQQQKAARDRTTRQLRSQSKSDLDADFEDFREMPLFPTAAELNVADETQLTKRLSKNITSGKYDSVMHYLDTHFRLLREDAITSIRDGIKAFRQSKESTEIQIYKNVQMRGITASTIGVQYRVSFEIDANINWERSKRLMFGSLLCLSPDGFKDLVIWATVASRDANLLQNKREVDIRLSDGYDPRFDPHACYTMVESVSTYYEAYAHVLQALQRTQLDKFPFLDYLIQCKPDVGPPTYLLNNDTYNLIDVFDSGTTYFPILRPDWPADIITSMDDSQMGALKQALTKEFAIIQGPPGTGKTFVGLKVMRALLDNRNLRGRAPILVVCYTNHALDQFLEGVLQFEENVVRIGSRSRSEELKKRNIRTLAMQAGFTGKEQNRQRKAINQEIKELQGELAEIFEDLKKPTLDRVNIEKVALADQFTSLFQGTVAAGDALSDELLLESWLGFKAKELVSNAAKSATKEKQSFAAFPPSVDDEFDDETIEDLQMDRMVAEDDDTPNVGVLELEEIQVGELSESIRNCTNVWKLSKPDRHKLYLHWLSEYRREEVETVLSALCDRYEQLCKQKRMMESELQLQVLSGAAVIGMTTTGVAKFQRLIQATQPEIIIVEEAAEVLEAHIVTSLSAATKHLILIGDHEQLRPSTAVHRLATKYHLDVSLFERMVNNKLEVKTLLRQRRMRPQISALLKPIYPELYNHPDVEKYPSVKGISCNIYFVDHNEPESLDGEGTSKSNQHEAAFLARLCKHLLMQGYTNKQITILTAYSGQVRLLRNDLRNLNITNVYVTSVDNYQGEENDIILLSLVRSNKRGIIGFLSTSNRICVALSRAKIGFYLIGNASLLGAKNGTWSKILEILRSGNAIGTELVLQCQLHPQKTTAVARDSDFKKAEDGGCDKQCGATLECGHVCPRLCHPYSHSEVRCFQSCTKVQPCGHKCQRRCFEDCGDCEIPTSRTLTCGHTQLIPCFIDVAEWKCDHKCERKLSCGHRCALPCGYECNSRQCREIVSAKLLCGHVLQVECNVVGATKTLECSVVGCNGEARQSALSKAQK